jgi:hypothetical protein
MTEEEGYDRGSSPAENWFNPPRKTWLAEDPPVTSYKAFKYPRLTTQGFTDGK